MSCFQFDLIQLFKIYCIIVNQINVKAKLQKRVRWSQGNSNNRCYYLFPTYDANYKQFSPGKILLNELVNDCKNNNLKYFDLTIGSEDYKKKWSNNMMNSCSTLKSINLNGYVYILFIRVKMYIKSKSFNNSYINRIFRKFKKNDT